MQEFIKEEFTARCNQVAGQIHIVLPSGPIVRTIFRSNIAPIGSMAALINALLSGFCDPST